MTIAKDFGAEVAIAAGLSAGDEVIDNPSETLAQGDVVRIGGEHRERAGMRRRVLAASRALARRCSPSADAISRLAFKRRRSTTPAQYKTAPPPRRGPSSLAENWWRELHSPALDRLETRIETDNPDYAAALARYERAKAMLDLNASAFYPRSGSDQELSFNKQSQHRPLRSANQPTYYGANQLLGQVSWEVDIWGRVRDQVDAAKAGAQANQDLFAATRISLHAGLARTYIALRGADAQARCWRAPSRSIRTRSI